MFEIESYIVKIQKALNLVLFFNLIIAFLHIWMITDLKFYILKF